MPAIYNSLRPLEMPIPPVEVTSSENEQFEENLNEQEFTDNEVVGDVGNEPAVPEQGAESSTTVSQQDIEELVDFVGNNVTPPSQIAHESNGANEQFGANESDENISQEELKPNFEEVYVDEDDEQEFENLFHIEQQSENDTEEPRAPAKAMTVIVDKDIQVTFTSLADFKPMKNKNGYVIKAKDMLSDNVPFKQNVST